MRTELGKSNAPNASTLIGFCAPRCLTAPWHVGADREKKSPSRYALPLSLSQALKAVRLTHLSIP
jgi:hypothetical protein